MTPVKYTIREEEGIIKWAISWLQKTIDNINRSKENSGDIYLLAKRIQKETKELQKIGAVIFGDIVLNNIKKQREKSKKINAEEILEKSVKETLSFLEENY